MAEVIRSIFALLLSLLIPGLAFAALEFPRGMTRADRRAALDVLGAGAMVKILGDPYPLGGYSGWEMGLSVEQMDTSSISRLGQQQVHRQDQTRIFNLVLGKGLYYNIDFFLQFAPPGQGEEFSSFGGVVRWGFYESQNWPINLSLQLGANSGNFQNLVATTSQTMDLIFGYNLVDLSVFLGGGLARSSGLFIGGTGGITDDNETQSEAISNTRYIAGLSYRWEKFFLAGEYSHSNTPVFSAKLGFRY